MKRDEMPIELAVSELRLSVCKFAEAPASLADGLTGTGFLAVTRTPEELSVVCETERVAELEAAGAHGGAGVRGVAGAHGAVGVAAGAHGSAIAREDGWRMLKVSGPLDFGLVGVLARISSALAGAGVPLFAISTFDTDYILVKEADLQSAVCALRDAGMLLYSEGR